MIAHDKVYSIQYLRALAVILVVSLHLHDANSNGVHIDEWIAKIGNVGVDIFFVISGFVIWITTSAKPQSIGAFLKKRFIRIVPLYFLLTALILVISAARPGLVNTSAGFAHAALSFLFIAHPHPNFPTQFWPILVPGWTLNYEIFFYAIFAALLGLNKTLRFSVCIGLLAALSILSIFTDPHTTLGFYTNPILLEFGAGLCLGRLWESNGRTNIRAGLAAIATGISLLLFLAPFQRDELRYLVWGLPAVLIVGGLLITERAAPFVFIPILNRIGDASYSIYLTQFITVATMAKMLKITGSVGQSQTGSIVFYATGLAVVYYVGIACHRYVELPLTKMTKRLFAAKGIPLVNRNT